MLPSARPCAAAHVLAAACTAIFLSCAFFERRAFAQAPAGKGSTFYNSTSANPTTLFPLTDSDAEASAVYDNFYESLLERHWDSYEWRPLVAHKWELSPDGKSYTFWIDPKAKFQDGSKVTPEDVKFSFDVIFMEGVDSAVLKPYYAQIEKVEIIGSDAVKFTTKDIYYKNFDVVAGLTILSKKHYLALYKKDKSLAKAESTRTPMGTSRWILDKWDQGQQLILRRNEDYWDKERNIKEGRWNHDRLVYRVILDDSSAFERFKKGEITMRALTPKQWQLQSGGPEFQSKLVKVKAVNKLAVGYGYVAWNNAHPILKSADVRWALAHLMNLDVWIKRFDFGLSEATVGPYSPKGDEHDPALKHVPFDPKAARERLAKAGWTQADKDGVLIKDGKRLEITILYPTQAKESVEPKLTEYKNQAAKVGVSLQLKAVEWTTFTKLMEERNFDAVCLAWTRVIDPDLKQIWHTDSIKDRGSNFIQYSNPEVDKLIDEHRRQLDRAKRVALSRKIEALIHADQPYAFMTERKYTLYAHQKGVKKDKDTYNYSIGTDFWRLPQQ